MSDSTIIDHYEGGVPFNAKGEPIIIITGDIPEGGGSGGGTTGGGGGGGSTSQSGHSLAKWSTENLKKSQAELQKTIAHINQLLQNQRNLVKDLSAKAKSAADQAIAFARKGPTVTDKAHENNAKLEYEGRLHNLRKAQAEAEKKQKEAQAEAERVQREQEQKQKELEETERKLKEAEAEEKRIAELSPEERNLVYAERDLAATNESIQAQTNTVNTLNQNLTNAQNQINTLTGSLNSARNELPGLKAKCVEAKDRVDKTVGMIMDPHHYRIHFEAKALLTRVTKTYDDKKAQVDSLQNQVNQANKNANDIRAQIAAAQQKQNELNAQKAANQAKIAQAKKDLEIATFKEMFDKVIDIFGRVSGYYKDKYKNLAKEFADISKGKQVKNVKDALEKYEKYYDVMNKKFNVADRTAIANALKSVQYDDWSRQFHIYARGFSFTGKVSTAYDTAKDFQVGVETGNWKPFFLDVEKWLADKAITPLLATLVSYVGATYPILGGALPMAILLFVLYTVVSYLVERYILDDVSDVLNGLTH